MHKPHLAMTNPTSSCHCEECLSDEANLNLLDHYSMEDAYFIYILTNKYHTALYTGVTSDLYYRIQEHRLKVYPGFTAKYNVRILVYYEQYGDVNDAIAREKAIKGGSRKRKIDLINSMNPSWEDLWEKEFGNEKS
jgi:putative endonuclease